MKLVLVCVLVLLVVIPSSAQEDYPECEFSPTFEAIQAEFANVTDWNSLEAFNDTLDSSMAYCIGLYWTGDGVQESTVFGPLVIPAGIYKHVVTTEGFIITNFEWLTPDCEMNFFPGVSVSSGEAINGSEEVYRSDIDCEVLMTVMNVQKPWIVEFRPIQ